MTTATHHQTDTVRALFLKKIVPVPVQIVHIQCPCCRCIRVPQMDALQIIIVSRVKNKTKKITNYFAAVANIETA